MSNQDFITYAARWIREKAIPLAVVNGFFAWACVIYILRHK